MAIDANVEAPAAAHETCYELGEGVGDDLFPWRRVLGDANIFGPRAVAVPGSVAGLALALARFGTMALADVIAPAIRLAEEGFVPDWYVAQAMALYTRELRAFPETARTYLRDGLDIYRPPVSRDGDLFANPTSRGACASSPRRGRRPSTAAPSPRPSTPRCRGRAAT